MKEMSRGKSVAIESSSEATFTQPDPHSRTAFAAASAAAASAAAPGERTLRSFVRLRPVAGWNEAGEKSVKAGEISGAGEIEQLRSALLCVADERDYLQRQVDRMYMESVDRASGIFIVNVGKYGAAHLISNVVGHEELTTD